MVARAVLLRGRGGDAALLLLPLLLLAQVCVEVAAEGHGPRAGWLPLVLPRVSTAHTLV